jgi:hypothetical protein
MDNTTQKTQQDAAPMVGCALWTVKDAAAFLQKSRRWMFLQLRLPDDAVGSIPHVKLGRTPRFIPDDMQAWAAMGFPPAATFRQWRDAENRRQRKAG